jgi:hypothetical protein
MKKTVSIYKCDYPVSIYTPEDTDIEYMYIVWHEKSYWRSHDKTRELSDNVKSADRTTELTKLKPELSLSAICDLGLKCGFLKEDENYEDNYIVVDKSKEEEFFNLIDEK